MVLLAHWVICGSGAMHLTLLFMGAGCHSIVIGTIVVVFIIAGQLQLFVGWLFVRC